MLKKIARFSRHPISIGIILNTIGNYLNIFFSVVFVYVIVRVLNPTEYGVLSVLLSIAYVLSSVLDFGTPATIFSYLPALVEKRTSQMYRFIKSALFYQTLFSAVVITLLLIFFPYLDKVFFKTKAPYHELVFTALSVLFFIWQNFLCNCLYAAKKILITNIYLNVANLIKTLILFILIFTHTLSVGSIIFVYGIIGPLIFYLFLLFDKKYHLPHFVKADIQINEFRPSYTLVNFLASQFYNLGLRMDLFLLSYYQFEKTVGYYGLAQKVILTIMATTVSITQIISPYFSKIKTKSDLLIQFKRAVLYLLIPTLLFFLVIFTPKVIFDFFFTKKYAGAIIITKWLSLAYIINPIINLPTLFLLYTMKKPQIILAANLALFIVISTISYFFIPRYGVIAPIVGIAIGFLLGIIISIGAWRQYQKLPN